jgi:hypothetical protein
MNLASKLDTAFSRQKRILPGKLVELDALLPAILQSSRGFRLRTASSRQVDPAGDRAFR